MCAVSSKGSQSTLKFGGRGQRFQKTNSAYYGEQINVDVWCLVSDVCMCWCTRSGLGLGIGRTVNSVTGWRRRV